MGFLLVVVVYGVYIIIYLIYLFIYLLFLLRWVLKVLFVCLCWCFYECMGFFFLKIAIFYSFILAHVESFQ